MSSQMVKVLASTANVLNYSFEPRGAPVVQLPSDTVLSLNSSAIELNHPTSGYALSHRGNSVVSRTFNGQGQIGSVRNYDGQGEGVRLTNLNDQARNIGLRNYDGQSESVHAMKTLCNSQFSLPFMV